MLNCLAILETMWDWRQITSSAGHTRQAPRFFKINPKNFSGRRLYTLIGSGNSLLVTNACRELVNAAHKHGVPDPRWLAQNLTIACILFPYAFDVILVCGKVAQAAFKQCGFQIPASTRVIEIPHPAARACWNKEYIETVRNQIKGIQQ